MKFQMIEHHGDDSGKHRLGEGEDAGFLRTGVARPFQKGPERNQGAADDGKKHAECGYNVPGRGDKIRSHHQGEDDAAQKHGGPYNFHGAIGFRKAGGGQIKTGKAHSGDHAPKKGLAAHLKVRRIAAGDHEEEPEAAQSQGGIDNGLGPGSFHNGRHEDDEKHPRVLNQGRRRRIGIGDGGKVAVLHA